MMFDFLLDDAAATSSLPEWVVPVVVGVFLVGFVFITIIPNRKRQKQQQQMLNELKPGTRVATIGGLMGKVVTVNSDGTVEIDIGAKGCPVVIVITRQAIAYNLDAIQGGVPTGTNGAPTQTASGDVDSEAPVEEKKEESTAEDPIVNDKEDDSI